MTIQVQEGQTLFDIALEYYGDISGLWWLLEDNNLNFSDEIQAGQNLEVRDEIINRSARFFRGENRKINNSDQINLNEDEPLVITIEEIRNEVYGGDGYIKIKVSGGKPSYSYLWSSGATTKNLLNVSAGAYTLLVEDAKGNQASVAVSIGTDTTGNFLAERASLQDILTTSGEKIRLNVYL